MLPIPQGQFHVKRTLRSLPLWTNGYLLGRERGAEPLFLPGAGGLVVGPGLVNAEDAAVGFLPERRHQGFERHLTVTEPRDTIGFDREHGDQVRMRHELEALLFEGSVVAAVMADFVEAGLCEEIGGGKLAPVLGVVLLIVPREP